MKNLIFSILTTILLILPSPSYALIHAYKGLTGGASANLDGVPVAYISDGEIAVGSDTSNIWRNYHYDASNNNTTNPESSPDIIVPDNNVSGTGAWILDPIEIDEITEGNTTVKVVDTGTGEVQIIIDGTLVATWTLADGLVMASTSDPALAFYDSDAVGTAKADQLACRILSNMTTTTEDAEDADIWITCMIGGTETSLLLFDASDNRWETTKDLYTTGTIQSTIKQGADITGNVSPDYATMRGVMFKATAVAIVSLPDVTVYGVCASYRIRDSAEKLTLDPYANTKINLAGTAGAAGQAIEATGAGEYVTICSTTDTDGSGTDGWDVYGPTSGWAFE